MANQPKDHLFQLIKSLTKAEKRSFKIYAMRNSPEDAKFLQLFDAIDKQHELDEEALVRRVTGLHRSQLPNLKAHLYRQILTSLRLNYIAHNIDIQIREHIDHARILYDKGLYIQSLKVLEKAKQTATRNSRLSLATEILGFEKLIESQYITRSLRDRADQLITETDQALRSVTTYHQLSNLALRLYGIYIKAGHARNGEDHRQLVDFFRQSLSDIDLSNIGFIETHYLNVCHAWYSLLIQDFPLQYRYASKWIGHFRGDPEMLALEPVWFLKGMHVLLEALFVLEHAERHEEEILHLQGFLQDPPCRLNENMASLGFQYYYTARIHTHFMQGTFSDGLALVPELLRMLEQYADRIDPHRVLVFYYKIACLHFGAGDNPGAIDWLNRIINYPDTRLREDIHCFARILNLIAHFEMGNELHLDYQLRSTYRFIRKMNDLNQVQEEILKFIRSLRSVDPRTLRESFIRFRDRLLTIREQPYQLRAFLYLDIISWLECKIDEKPVQEIIRAKYEARRARR